MIMIHNEICSNKKIRDSSQQYVKVQYVTAGNVKNLFSKRYKIIYFLTVFIQNMFYILFFYHRSMLEFKKEIQF